MEIDADRPVFVPRTFVKRLAAALALAAAVSGAALAPAAGVAEGRRAAAPTVRLAGTGLGRILVDRSGQTLFLFSRDRGGRDRCIPVPGCIETWPALTTTHKPVAGRGVRASLLGTIKLHGRVKQVTYAGHPLYTYALNLPGRSTFNIGSVEYGGAWEAVNRAGEAVD